MLGATPFTLASDEIHVWGFALDVPRGRAEQFHVWLSADERKRAAAFHFERDRNHFAVARGQLRELLGNYLGRAPGELRFATGSHGKPRLDGAPADADLRFNVSHSHGRALIAVTRGAEIGVDLEQMRGDVDCAGIVASQFSPAERAAWLALLEARRRDAFFHGWVRKEAYVKARGEGLSHPPSAYTVDLDPDGSGALLADTLTPEATRAWTVQAIAVPAGFAAALAYFGARRRVIFRAV